MNINKGTKAEIQGNKIMIQYYQTLPLQFEVVLLWPAGGACFVVVVVVVF